MKKTILLAFALAFCFTRLNVFAAENNTKDPMNWSASMSQESTDEEKEEGRWSVVVENEIGINAYDVTSIHYGLDADRNMDDNTMHILTRTVYAPKDQKFAQRLADAYKNKLAKDERVQMSNISMVFRMHEKTFYVESKDVYSNKKKLIEHKENPAKFKPVPKGSVAEAMYEICLKVYLKSMTDPEAWLVKHGFSQQEAKDWLKKNGLDEEPKF